MIAQELCQLLPVLAIFVDAQFQILGELFVELLVVVLVFCNFIEELKALFDKVLANHLQDLALLQHLSGDVQGQVFRVNYASDKVEVLWNQLFAVVHDEHSSHVQLDVVLDLAVLKQVKRCPLWYKQKGSKLELPLNREVFHS